MNIIRMYLWHGVQIPARERHVMVKYLSDTQGLAPAETAPYRYILERRPNVVEDIPDETIGVMCARCHSYARVALQYRDADSWLKLSHMHAGQIPTIEYHALARDRDWWVIASKEVPGILGKMLPMKTSAWTAWSSRSKANMQGAWAVVGRRPGRGAYTGTATITRTSEDEYAISYDLQYDNGAPLGGVGTSIVYTGYEWRGAVKLGDDFVNEVYAVSEDGNTISGRWFLENADESGGDVTMVREGATSHQILAVSPAYLRAGEEAEITIFGTGLNGPVKLGPDVTVQEISSDSNRVVVRAKAGDQAKSARPQVSVGDTSTTGLFTVYRTVDSVKVEPGFAISRVGGGTTPAVNAQFEAVAYANGADGEAGTADDIRIGVMPAEWSVANLTDVAKAMDDVNHSGQMLSNGLFVPAVAGPNPQRKFQTNNAGELAVTATVNDGGRQVKGQGTLVATVQRWNDPPIR